MNNVEKVSFFYLCGAVDQFDAGINDFTGCLPAKDGTSGIFSNEFRYKFHLIAENKTPLKIIASYYWGCMSFDNTDPSSVTENEFEASDDGALKAYEWLQSVYDNA